MVVAGPAGRAAVRERLCDAPLVVLERRGADRVRDPVAVGLDRLLAQLVLEEIECRFGPVAVRDVSERLPATVGVEAAFEASVVRTKRADDGPLAAVARC